MLPAFTRGIWLDGIFPSSSTGPRASELAKVRKDQDRALDALRAEILGPAASPLERLLAERIIITHVALYYEDHRLALNSENNHEAAAMLHERVAKLEKRYLASIRALAEVRRLQLPSVQFNVAQQQVVAGTISVGERER
jgi:hypothetical protein